LYKNGVRYGKKTPVKPSKLPKLPKLPTTRDAAYLAAASPMSTAQYVPQKARVVEESPYFDMRKKLDVNMFGSYNPMTMYGPTPSTNTGTNQSKVATMATGGYLNEEPMDMQEILNILERG
jgi:hypothetical protein